MWMFRGKLLRALIRTKSPRNNTLLTVAIECPEKSNLLIFLLSVFSDVDSFQVSLGLLGLFLV